MRVAVFLASLCSATGCQSAHEQSALFLRRLLHRFHRHLQVALRFGLARDVIQHAQPPVLVGNRHVGDVFQVTFARLLKQRAQLRRQTLAGGVAGVIGAELLERRFDLVS